jgi:toxin HigB-1
MIISFRDRRTRVFAEGGRVKEFSGFAEQAHKRLRLLHLAKDLPTLRSIRSNRLEVLRGDRAGQFSIRINEQWRVCFEWPGGSPGPVNVEIVDYHD